MEANETKCTSSQQRRHLCNSLRYGKLVAGLGHEAHSNVTDKIWTDLQGRGIDADIFGGELASRQQVPSESVLAKGQMLVQLGSPLSLHLLQGLGIVQQQVATPKEI